MNVKRRRQAAKLPQARAQAPSHIPSRSERTWGFAAVLTMALWATLIGLIPITANDIWLQMCVGRDVLATGSFPWTDVYSATAQGRPFIAHEWLSGVIFHLSAGHLWALSVIGALISGGCFLLLYLSLAPGQRRQAWTLPLLALAFYTIRFRMQIRPHMFTLGILCLLMFVMERWRRDRRSRALWVLPPVFLFWVNAHGAYMIGLVLMVLWTGVTALMWRFPALHRSEEVGAPYTPAQVRSLALVTVVCVLATLINPYGYHSWLFSFDLGSGQDYFKRSIMEWLSPFVIDPRTGSFAFIKWGTYWCLAYLLTLAVCSLTALLRLFRISLLDLALLVVGVLLSLKANRFVPYLAILGYLGTVRGLGSLAGRFRWTWLDRGLPRFSLVLAGGLLVSAMIWGYAYDNRQFRLPGWGYKGYEPVEPVALIKRMGWKGVVFNEYRDGAYIIYHLHPDVRPVMDSRVDVYGEELYETYLGAKQRLPEFRDYLRKYDVNLALMLRKTRFPDNLRWLEQQPQWSQVYADRRYVLFKRS